MMKQCCEFAQLMQDDELAPALTTTPELDEAAAQQAQIEADKRWEEVDKAAFDAKCRKARSTSAAEQ